MASQREIRLTGDELILYRSIANQSTEDEGGAVAARQHYVTAITDAGETPSSNAALGTGVLAGRTDAPLDPGRTQPVALVT
jgi:hypothetical protein